MLRQWTFGWLGMLAGAVLALLCGADAMAAELRLPPSTRSHQHVIVPDALPARVVTRHTVAPRQPQVVPVVITHQPHYIDLDADYGRQGAFRIDDDHWIMKAQRLARSATRGRARIIHGSPARVMTAGKDVPQPRLIIERPHHIPPQEQRRSKPKPGQWVMAD